MVTADKVKLVLKEHIDQVNAKAQWQTPLGIFSSLLLTFVVSDFRTVVFPKEVWQATFLLSTALSAYWLLKSLWNAVRQKASSVDTIVEKLKKPDG